MRRHALGVLLLILVNTIGCGQGEPRGIALSGRVSFRGKPVEVGMIYFQPEFDTPSRQASGQIKAGYYSIPSSEGPQNGRFRVDIFSGDPSSWVEAKAPDSIPARYNANSDLRVTIPDRKSFEYDFRLE